jgi:uncharacterized protein involved in exopolysaccharide biosynthesis
MSDSAGSAHSTNPLLVLISSRWQIAAIAAIGVLVAAVHAWTSPPVFRAEVTLVPAKQDEGRALSALGGSLGGLASLAGFNLPASSGDTERALAILRSRDFTDAFIRDLKLEAVLSAECGLSLHGVRTSPATVRRAYECFDTEVRSVQQDKKAGVVTLAVEWHDPAVAAQWANALVARLNGREQQAAIDEANRNVAFLNQQLVKTDVAEMRQLIYRLIESKTSDIMMASGRPEYAFKVIDPAVAPERRIRPRRVLQLLTGLVLGLMAGAGGTLLRARISELLPGQRRERGYPSSGAN